jgi:tRNA(Ile)-lysidine synthase TilS/MesJ
VKSDSEIESRRLEKRLKERFIKAMATYHLIEDDDHILVGLSGGKDSLLLTELLAKRAKIDHPRFKVEALHVRMENIHYETDTSYLQQFCEELGIRLHIKSTRFEVDNPSIQNDLSNQNDPETAARLRKQKQPCFLCSWQRRKEMFNLAQELGCNKIALGHHQDDLIHTALMNLTFQGRFDTMPASLKMRKMPLTIIRPLCIIKESDIKAYAEMQGYQKQTKLCPYETDSHRADIKRLFNEMEQINPEARFSIWRALIADNKLIEE